MLSGAARADPWRNTGEWITGARNRVNRGGSFNNTAVNARSANRNHNTPENRNNNLGVRPSKVSQRQIAAVIADDRSMHCRTEHEIPRSTSRAGCGRTNSMAPPGIVGAGKPLRPSSPVWPLWPSLDY